MAIEFSCPACHQLVRTPDAAAGKKGRCPQCQAIVQIPAVLSVGKTPAPVKPAPSKAAPAAPTKPTSNPQAAKNSESASSRFAPREAEPPPIEFGCVWCGELVRTPASAAGKRGKCPHCGRVVKIPAEEKPKPRKTEADLTLADDELTPVPSAAKTGRPPSPIQNPTAKPATAKPAPVKQPASVSAAKVAAPKATVTKSTAGKPPVPPNPGLAGLAPLEPLEELPDDSSLTPLPDDAADGLTPLPDDPLSGLTPLDDPLIDPLTGLTPLPDSEPLQPLPVLPKDKFATLTPLPKDDLAVLAPLPDDPLAGISDMGSPLGYTPAYGAAAYGAAAAQPRPVISDSRRRGLPWEREPSMESFSETVKLVITAPHEAFGMMRRGGGIANPFGFMIVSGVLSPMLLLLEYFLFQVGVILYFQYTVEGIRIQWERFFLAFGLGALFVLIAALVSSAIGGFISALVLHLSLLIFGGANAGYEGTYRVVAFGAGAVNMLLAIPVVGWFFALVMTFVVLIFGLMYGHQTSGGKAALAVFAPGFVVTFCLCPVMLLLFGSAIPALLHLGR